MVQALKYPFFFRFCSFMGLLGFGSLSYLSCLQATSKQSRFMTQICNVSSSLTSSWGWSSDISFPPSCLCLATKHVEPACSNASYRTQCSPKILRVLRSELDSAAWLPTRLSESDTLAVSSFCIVIWRVQWMRNMRLKSEEAELSAISAWFFWLVKKIAHKVKSFWKGLLSVVCNLQLLQMLLFLGAMAQESWFGRPTCASRASAVAFFSRRDMQTFSLALLTNRMLPETANCSKPAECENEWVQRLVVC